MQIVGMPAAKEAFSLHTVSMMPRTFGPTSRMPYFRAISMHCCSNALPAGPTSRKPAVMITAPFKPRWPLCSSTRGTTLLGTRTTARSTGSGQSSTLGYALSPKISGAVGLTG